MADIGRAATIDSLPTADPCGVPPWLNGLIAFLSPQSGGNIYDLELAEIRGSRSCQEVKNATNLARDSAFESTNLLPLSIHFDFKTMKVTPASDTIRADSPGNNPLKSWVVEASQDSKNWRSLDNGMDESDLNHEGVLATLSLRMVERLWFIQLCQTGYNHTGRRGLRPFCLLFNSHL
jgi:hypothetical protein